MILGTEPENFWRDPDRYAISAPRNQSVEAKLSRIALDDVMTLHRLQLRRKISLLLIMVALVPVVTLVQGVWPDVSWVHTAIETLGLWLILSCVFGRAWCALYIGGRKSTELVELGPYSISRNPLYLFSCLGAIGVGLRTASITLGILFVLAAIAVMLPVVRVEEMVMRRTFAAAFEAYCAKVPRFGPRFPLWRDAQALTITPRHLYRVLTDSLVFILTIPVITAIHWLQVHAVLPVLLQLP